MEAPGGVGWLGEMSPKMLHSSGIEALKQMIIPLSTTRLNSVCIAISPQGAPPSHMA